jgi:hypothetical protein
MYLILKDNLSRELKLNRNQAYYLEVKLNLSDKGKAWRNIGDILYYFFRDYQGYSDETIVKEINHEQLNFLNSLLPTPQI